MIDRQAAVRTQYGVEPTAEAIRAACDRWDWACELVVDPVRGLRTCSITVRVDDGAIEQLGVGTTMDEAACRALVELPHDPLLG